MTTKPQDIVVLAKLISYETTRKNWSQGSMALELCLSSSQINYALKRLARAKLIVPVERAKEMKLTPIIQACEEFFIHGVKYLVPAEFGALSRGIPTAYAGPTLSKHILPGNDPIPLWPHGEGMHRGIALKPLYHCVPESIIKYPDPFFYDLLSLLDAIRSGRAREKKIGAENISTMLDRKNKQSE
jgi:hypothetical protein